MSRKILLTIALAAALILVAACNDDDECVNCPDPGTPYPTLANIWPHADGTAWTFDLEYRELMPLPPPPATPAALPTFEEIHEALQFPLAGEIVTEGEGLYRFAFDGLITTDSEAVGQKVVQTFFVELPGVTGSPAQGLPTVSDRILTMVARARPDLRPAIRARYGLEEKSLDTITPPMLLGGYAFSYEEDGYFGYGDLDQNHSWVYLEGDLSVGSEFSLQLVPLLADDIWMFGRVWSVGTRTIKGRTFEKVLECLYLVDLGEQILTDENGNPIGTAHPYYYGNILFAPELGPVAGIERRVDIQNGILQDPGPTMFEYVMDLVGATFPESAAPVRF